MSRVYWDTMLFIYWVEDHTSFAKKVRQVYDSMEQRGDVQAFRDFAALTVDCDCHRCEGFRPRRHFARERIVKRISSLAASVFA